MMKMPERIDTERLVLRVPNVNDASVIFAGWAQDKEVTRYLTWRPHQRIEQTRQFIQSCILAWEHETRFPYMITLKEDNEVIGMIDPRIEGPKIGLGYVIRRTKDICPKPLVPSLGGHSSSRQFIGSTPQQMQRISLRSVCWRKLECNVKGFYENILSIRISAMCRVIVICSRS